MLHRKLSYVSVKTLIKKKFLPPLFFTGRKLRPLGIGIEAPDCQNGFQLRKESDKVASFPRTCSTS